MKNVLVTGGTGNLGKSVIEKFINEGYQVITTVTPGKASAFHSHKQVDVFEGDLTDEKSVTGMVSKIIVRYNRIDAAALLVGAYAPGAIQDTDGSIIRKMFSLNFETAFFVARPIFQHMLQQGTGRLIFVGSKPGIEARDAAQSLAYGLSKSLLFHLAAALNVTATGKDVTASVVVPGTIDTPQNREAMPDSDFDSWVKPEEIANAITHICREEARSWKNTVLKIY